MRVDVSWGKIDKQKVSSIVPEGIHPVRIVNTIDKKTKNGDPMVSIALMVQEGGYDLVWDNIVIPNEGSPAIKIKGRTQHFLHCIGEPYEDNFTCDSDRWLDKTCTVRIKHEAPNGYHDAIRPIVEEYIIEEHVSKGEFVLDENQIENQTELPF